MCIFERNIQIKNILKIFECRKKIFLLLYMPIGQWTYYISWREVHFFGRDFSEIALKARKRGGAGYGMVLLERIGESGKDDHSFK